MAVETAPSSYHSSSRQQQSPRAHRRPPFSWQPLKRTVEINGAPLLPSPTCSVFLAAMASVAHWMANSCMSGLMVDSFTTFFDDAMVVGGGAAG